MTDEPKAAAVLKTFNDRAEALAKRGDFGPLIAIARIGRLTKNQQKLVADILDGKIKRGRANIVETGSRHMEIGNHVLDLERSGMSTKAAVSHTIEALKVRERTVWAARKFAIGYYRAGRLVSKVLRKP